jgi:osmotically-inducible protein OsmY
MKHCAKLATLAMLMMLFAITRGTGQQSQTQNPQTANPSQQTEQPPHVSQEPDPAARNLERTILSALQQDPHMAYSRVRVHVSDTEVVLSGVVLTATARDQAAQIAAQQAGGRKITNRIKVNPNTNPGPGI